MRFDMLRSMRLLLVCLLCLGGCVSASLESRMDVVEEALLNIGVRSDGLLMWNPITSTTTTLPP